MLFIKIDTTSSEQSVDDEDKENNTSIDQTRGKQPQLGMQFLFKTMYMQEIQNNVKYNNIDASVSF